MDLQKTVKEYYVKTLKDEIKSGKALSLYRAEEFEIDFSRVKRLAGVYAPDNLKDKRSLLAAYGAI